METSEHEAETKPTRKRTSKKIALFGIGFVVVAALLAGLWAWQATRPKSLMPQDIRTQATAFTPYFYFDKIPAGYELSASQLDKELGVALFSLKKLGRPTVSISEQRLSGNLNPNTLLKGGESVRDAVKPAIINSVEGRYVGIMVDTDNKTLILLNTTGDAEKQDLKDLLQGLKPIK